MKQTSIPIKLTVLLALQAVLMGFEIYHSRLNQDSEYYSLAYFYGTEGTLLITPISNFSVFADITVSPKTQIYFYTRDNNAKFKNFIRSKYPKLVDGLTEEVETIMVNQDLAELADRREYMINQSGDNLIELHDFPFKPPQFDKVQNQAKPQ